MKACTTGVCIIAALSMFAPAQAQMDYAEAQRSRYQKAEESPFTRVVKATERLSERVGESYALWEEGARVIDDQYGDFAEDHAFEEDLEIDGDEIPEIDDAFSINGETLNAIYIAAVHVDWRFETVDNELDFLRAFIETNSFPEESEEANAQILEHIEELSEQMDRAGNQWRGALRQLDKAIEGKEPSKDQGGNPLPTQGQQHRSNLKALLEEGGDAPSASFTRSELETGGWNLTKAQDDSDKRKKSSKKKHAQTKSNPAGLSVDQDELNYSVIAWAGLFIEHELALLDEAVVEFADAVDLALDETQPDEE